MQIVTSNVIDDGYTRDDGYIGALPGIHEGLAFSYRPMLPEKVEELDGLVANAGDEDKIRLIAMSLAGSADGKQPGYVLKWSEVDRKTKQPKPLTFEHMRRLPYQLLRDVRRVVTGFLASDPLPNATDVQTSELMLAVKREAGGDAPGLQQLADDQKNSQPG
jgi:hypothetical protein